MTPHRQVRLILTEHRQHGTPFEAAWLSALRSLPRKVSELEADIFALLATKESWRAAYERTPVESHSLASRQRRRDAQTRYVTDSSSGEQGASDALLRALAA